MGIQCCQCCPSLHCEHHHGHRRVIMMSSQDTHGSLLNRVYELQCIREKELETMDLTEQMSSLSFSVSVPTVSSSDASNLPSRGGRHQQQPQPHVPGGGQ